MPNDFTANKKERETNILHYFNFLDNLFFAIMVKIYSL